VLPWFKEQFPLYLAPMAGFTDSVYRSLCKKQGADVLVSEFVLADRLLTGEERVWSTVDFSPEQRPMGVQIFGSDPEVMADAGLRVMERLRPDFLDINFGCPSERITCQDAGSSLLRDLPKLGRIVGRVVRRLEGYPVTAKMRIGWDDQSIVAEEAARIMEAEGIQALAVHGRTKEQGYRGRADWQVIARVAESVKIPVIGNGDIAVAEDVLRVRKETRCAGIMIGRAALGRPWIFKEIKTALETGEKPPPPSYEERIAVVYDYACELQRRLAPKQTQEIGWMRSRLVSLTKDMRGGRRLRQALTEAVTLADLQRMCQEYTEWIRPE
jgi:tRNA-dihydrouridine synthase B